MMRPNPAARKRGVACGGGVYSGGGAGWIRQQQQQRQQDSRLSNGVESPLGSPFPPGHLHEPVATGGRGIAGALDRLQQHPNRHGGESLLRQNYRHLVVDGNVNTLDDRYLLLIVGTYGDLTFSFTLWYHISCPETPVASFEFLWRSVGLGLECPMYVYQPHCCFVPTSEAAVVCMTGISAHSRGHVWKSRRE